MVARVRITINQAAINALVVDPRSPVYRQAARIGAACSAAAKVEAPVDSGRLRQSVQDELRPRPPVLTVRVSAPVNYARVVHEGHGVIVPRRKKVLRWRGKGGVVWARRVRAVKGNPFLVRAVELVTGKRVSRAR